MPEQGSIHDDETAVHQNAPGPEPTEIVRLRSDVEPTRITGTTTRAPTASPGVPRWLVVALAVSVVVVGVLAVIAFMPQR